MQAVTNLIHDFARLFFPHHCAGCGADTVNLESALCVRCLHALPVTNFHLYAGNPVEQQLTGRLSPVSAMAYCYFTRGAMMQELLHRIKYKGHTELGRLLGRMMGKALQESGRFEGIEALIPLPLHRAKERLRGYNQSVILCEGLAEVLALPVITNAVIRLAATQTQTHKNRIERWQNMQGMFRLVQPQLVAGKRLLLVDDVITTGATMDACVRALMEAEGVRLSVAALAWADS
jgi:ComF family protein